MVSKGWVFWIAWNKPIERNSKEYQTEYIAVHPKINLIVNNFTYYLLI
jgi:hypothetical protein